MESQNLCHLDIEACPIPEHHILVMVDLEYDALGRLELFNCQTDERL